jgi:hypothetical protein
MVHRTTVLFLCLGLLCLFTVQGEKASISDKIQQLKGYSAISSKFGHSILQKVQDKLSHTIIDWSRSKHPLEDDETFENLQEIIDKNSKVKEAIGRCVPNNKLDRPDFFSFLMASAGKVNKAENKVSFKGRCFERIDVFYNPTGPASFDLIINPSKRTGGVTCFEYYIIGTSLQLHFEYFYREKTHRISFKNLDGVEMEAANHEGVHVFGFCDSLLHFLPSLWKTFTMFLGGLGTNPRIPIFGPKSPKWVVKRNVKFMKMATGYQWKDRKPVILDLEKEIKDGDTLMIARFAGTDNFIQYTTGSHGSHCAVAMWENGKLYILESEGSSHWPVQGIQKAEYSEWLQLAKNSGYAVAIIPMKPEVRAKFNVTAAWEWYRSVEGMPYGYHNFLFTGIDTKYDNAPPLFDHDLFVAFISIMSNLQPNFIKAVWDAPINKRLGTDNLNFAEQTKELIKRNLTFFDLWKIPEQDGWVYYDGLSYVCSAFVVGMYKAGGLFGNLTVQATEFGPRDLYHLSFFDRNSTRPKQCVDADPELTYCQLMGALKMEILDYGTIEPYDNMNERCPSMPPEYTRPNGC